MDDVAKMSNQSLLTGQLDRVRGRAFTVHQENKVGVDSGTVNGVKFVVDEVPDTKVMNALDEVSRLFADRGTKPIGGHQLGEKLTAEQQYFTAVDSWKKILPQMPGDQFIEGRLSDLRQQVRDGTMVLNADMLLKMVADPSAEPSVRYAVLQSMKAMIAPGEVALARLIDEAVTKLMQASGSEIAAALGQLPEQHSAETVEMWQGVLPETPDVTLVGRRLENLRRQVRDGALPPDADALLKSLADMSASVSVRYAVLQSMKAMVAPGEVELSKLIDEAATKLMQANGPQIAAALDTLPEPRLTEVVAAWQVVLPEMPDAEPVGRQLENLREQVRDGALPPDVDAFLKTLADMSASAGVRYAVLQSMKAMLSPEEATLSAFVDKAVTQLVQTNGSEITAALGTQPGPQTARAVEAWQGVLPEMPNAELVGRQLENLRGQVRDSALSPVADAFLKSLADMSASVSVRYAVLQSMKSMLSPEEATLSALIDEAVARLLGVNGRQIATEINISQAVNKSATSSGELQELRDLYRSEIDGFESPQECFRSLLEKRGPGRILESLDFLTEGIGAELHSEMPSREPAMLGDILTQLKQVAIIKTVYDDAAQLVTRMSKEFGEHPSMNPEQLAGAFLQMVQSGAATKEIVSAFIDQLGVKGQMARLDCCREFQRLVRRMSSGVFTKESDRFGFVDASQDLMDDLIAEMEEA